MLNALILIIIKILYPYPIFAQGLDASNYINNGTADSKITSELSSNESELHNRLHRLLITSHKKYLNNEFEKAVDNLKEIVDMRFLYDWRADKRAIIANSYLRLIELDEDNQNHWIKEFIAFNGGHITDSEPIFNPELVDKIRSKALKIKNDTSKWYADNLPEGVDYIRLNGEKIYTVDISYDIFRDCTYRITLFHRDGTTQTRILTGEELMGYNWVNNKYADDTKVSIPQSVDTIIGFSEMDNLLINGMNKRPRGVKNYIRKNWKITVLSSVAAVILAKSINRSKKPTVSYERVLKPK